LTRFPITFDPWYRIISVLSFLPPSDAYVSVGPDEIAVRMSWGFRARFPRLAITSAAPDDTQPLSRGVHGLAGCWLVNGSGRGIVKIELSPDQRGYVMGIPVKLRQLSVSVADPQALVAALSRRASG
jgi:hypothetical protein